VLAAAHESRVHRVVYASSMHVYGPPAGHPLPEEAPTQPLSDYARAKLSAEQACVTYTLRSGLETVRLRYFHVFGPRQPAWGRYASLVPRIGQAVLAGEPPTLDSEPGQDLISVQDAVHAALLAGEVPRVAGKVYNVGRGRLTSARQIVDSFNRLLGTRIEPTFIAGLPHGDHHVPRIDRAETDLGFCAATDLETGLERWIESQRNWPGRPHFAGRPEGANPRSAEAEKQSK
jgi:UDP-glucose 4-epimerase